jgi:hypothetical protein
MEIGDLRKQLGRYPIHCLIKACVNAELNWIEEYSYVIKEQEKLMELALSPDIVGHGGGHASMIGDSTM